MPADTNDIQGLFDRIGLSSTSYQDFGASRSESPLAALAQRATLPTVAEPPTPLQQLFLRLAAAPLSPLRAPHV